MLGCNEGSDDTVGVEVAGASVGESDGAVLGFEVGDCVLQGRTATGAVV